LCWVRSPGCLPPPPERPGSCRPCSVNLLAVSSLDAIVSSCRRAGSALRYCLQSFPLDHIRLIARAVENMQDLHRSSRFAVIDQILPRREAAYTGRDLIASPANSGGLGQEREVLFESLDQPVGYFETGSPGPINKDFIQFPKRVL